MMRIYQFCLALGLLFLLSCSTTPKKQPPPPTLPAATADLNKIKAGLGRERAEVSAHKLQRFLHTYPSGDSADQAWILLGNIYFQKQDYKNAYQCYLKIVSAPYQSMREAEARALAAKSLFHLGRYDESLGLANTGLAKQDVPIEFQAELHELRFVIEQQLGNRLEALQDISFLAASHPQPDRRERYKIKGLEFVDSKLSEEELKKVAGSKDYGFLQAGALYRLGVMAWDQQDISRARDYMSSVKDKAPSTDLAEKAQRFIEQVDARRRVNSNTIGVVLPLSGPFAAAGYRSLRGIQLALGIFGPHPSGLRLSVMDNESNPDVARRAVEKLITEDSVIGVIGGLIGKTAFAEASKVQEMGVPMIALSQSAGLTDVGDNIFRNSFTSQMQVRALVAVAMGKLGMKRFAILYPNDAYGSEFSRIFWDEVVSRGGSIQGVQVYDPGQTDFHTPVLKLVGTYYAEERADEYRLRLKDWQEKQAPRSQKKPPDDLLPPIVDFDAIFIPDGVKAIGQIAPMLSVADVENVKLLGTNIWNTPELVKRGKKYVEDSVFVDSFLANDPEFKASSFYRDYHDTFQDDPGIFEVQAYDSALILRQILAEGESSRVGMKERLAHLKNFSGALGTLTMQPNHEVMRPAVTLSVKKGEIVKANL